MNLELYNEIQGVDKIYSMREKMFPGISVFLFFFLITSQLHPDIILLKNGTVLQGKVLEQDKLNVRIKINDKVVVYKKTELKKIRYESEITPNNDKQNETENLAQQKKAKEEARLEKERIEKERLEIEREEYRLLLKKMSSQNDNKVWKDIWRSAVVPGWGQRRQERNFAGNIFLTGFFISAGYALYQYKEYQEKSNKHNDLVTLAGLTSPVVIQNPAFALQTKDANLVSWLVFSNLYSNRTTNNLSMESANTALKILAGIYLVNLADAGFPFLRFSSGGNPGAVSFGVLPGFAEIEFMIKF